MNFLLFLLYSQCFLLCQKHARFVYFFSPCFQMGGPSNFISEKWLMANDILFQMILVHNVFDKDLLNFFVEMG